ncbi:MAG: vitamin K epoxide reductase family protein [Chloroflexota bacterium]
MDKRLKQITIFLAALGLLDSIYMTIFKLTNNENMCIGSHGCNIVNASGYSSIHGIPVAVVGVFGYLSILTLLYLGRRPGFLQTNEGMLLFTVTLTGFLFTVWLVYLEIAIIKAYCPFCITSQIVMTIIFILTVIRVIQQPLIQED